MKRFKYDQVYDNIICDHEDYVFILYQGIIKEFEPKFGEYGLTLRYSIFWYNFMGEEVSSVRLPFINGYRCEFTVGIENAGEIICYDEEESATLGANFTISSISRFFFHLDVTLYNDMADVIEEMKNMLEIAKHL